MHLNDAIAATETRKGPQCLVCQLIENPPADNTADDLRAVLASDLQHSHIARAFALITGDKRWTGRGQPISVHRAQHS